MNTTPLWVPLAVAALGLLGTVLGAIGGVLLTQRRADRRETMTWERERERERQRWAREDVLRTFEQRREAYGDFCRVLREAAVRVQNLCFGPDAERAKDLPDGWQYPTFLEYQRLRLYATPTVNDLALSAYRLLWSWYTAAVGKGDDTLSAQGEFLASEDELFAAMRRDLGIPEGEVGAPAASPLSP